MKKILLIIACLLAMASTAQAQKYVNGAMHQSYVTIGFTPMEGGTWGCDFIGVFGARISDSYYVGLETGYNAVDSDAGFVPIALNTRYMFPVNEKFLPFINVSAGAGIGTGENSTTGFYMEVGAGIDYKRLTFGVGYMGIDKRTMCSAGYIRIGIKFGGKTW